MSTEPQPEKPPEPENAPIDEWERAVADIAAYLSHRNFPDTELATLAHHFDPERPERHDGPLWRVIAHSQPPIGPDQQEALDCWTVIIAGTAKITEAGPRNIRGRRNPHHPERTAGRTLYAGTARFARQAVYPEAAMQNLLSAKGRQLRREISRAMATIAQERANCNITELANLLRYDLAGQRRELATARLAIATTYYNPPE